MLPSPDNFTIAVRFCPLLFELRKSEAKPSIPLPYRMIFAVATKCSVYLYDTQQKIPFGLISNIHYTRLTDLTWSHDGKFLLVSSTDGYCSIVHFADGELGVIYKEMDVQDIIESKSEKDDEPTKKKKKKPLKKSPVQSTMLEKESTVDEKENESLKELPINKLPEAIKEIIPVDKIIKSSELFSPEKTQIGSPATPIQVRKCPRMPEELRNSSENNDKKMTPVKDAPTTPKASLNNTPNRIEIRRFPRTSLQISAATTTLVNATSSSHSKNDDDWPKPITKAESPMMVTPSPKKTPRRIELQTIATTPKSKKKLL